MWWPLVNGIFWLKGVDAYAVNPGGTYATNIDLSCLLDAGFSLAIVPDGVLVSHPLCNGSHIVRKNWHLLYMACNWATHHAKRGKLDDLDHQIWWSTYNAIPAFEEADN